MRPQHPPRHLPRGQIPYAPIPRGRRRRPRLSRLRPWCCPRCFSRWARPSLLPEGRPALDQLAAELKARPGVRIRVSGYTDRVGEHDKNQVLSEQRATAVKDYLVKAGVEADRISTIGYGDSRPLFTSPNARNRRVEVEEVK
ncbi:OmpA family protein [Hymenobacter humi]|uniref:OmpA family protein n=1 Tax=Hymenobacter humi TaxID=1411620 RepID=A0ABW2U8G1_9BACT